jgi:putative salt-induced outer membrane protein YdiY
MMTKIILFTLLSQVLFADQVSLKNGSMLIGQIKRITERHISITTGFAGELVIEVNQIKSYTRLEEGSEQPLVYVESKKGFQLRPSVNELKTEESPWFRMLSLDLSKRLGNTQESSFSSGFRVTYKGVQNVMKLYGRFIRTEREELITADERKLGGDFARSFGEKKRNSWYARVEYEHDSIEDLSLRQTYGAGYGYYIVNSEQLSLRARLGVLYRHESYFNDEEQDSTALDVGVVYKQTLFENVKWMTEMTYSPGFNSGANYRVVHESSIEMPLLLQVDLTLRSGVEHTYNSLPSADREELDTKFFTRLEYNF